MLFKFINKRQKEILRCAPPSSHMYIYIVLFWVIFSFHLIYIPSHLIYIESPYIQSASYNKFITYLFMTCKLYYEHWTDKSKYFYIYSVIFSLFICRHFLDTYSQFIYEQLVFLVLFSLSYMLCYSDLLSSFLYSTSFVLTLMRSKLLSDYLFWINHEFSLIYSESYHVKRLIYNWISCITLFEFFCCWKKISELGDQSNAFWWHCTPSLSVIILLSLRSTGLLFSNTRY